VEVGRRLLIPGVITQNILNQYINMLKVLQLLDPQGLVFEQVTLPIKNYLLRRNDTLRCIISHLTEDNENYSKLTREVVKIPSKEYIE
jgi:anaphase-promoting complex subunit 2